MIDPSSKKHHHQQQQHVHQRQSFGGSAHTNVAGVAGVGGEAITPHQLQQPSLDNNVVSAVDDDDEHNKEL